jgi:hypothetical protein
MYFLFSAAFFRRGNFCSCRLSFTFVVLAASRLALICISAGLSGQGSAASLDTAIRQMFK